MTPWRANGRTDEPTDERMGVKRRNVVQKYANLPYVSTVVVVVFFFFTIHYVAPHVHVSLVHILPRYRVPDYYSWHSLCEEFNVNFEKKRPIEKESTNKKKIDERKKEIRRKKKESIVFYNSRNATFCARDETSFSSQIEKTIRIGVCWQKV